MPPSITVIVSSTDVAAVRIDSWVAIEKSTSSVAVMPCRLVRRVSVSW